MCGGARECVVVRVSVWWWDEVAGKAAGTAATLTPSLAGVSVVASSCAKAATAAVPATASPTGDLPKRYTLLGGRGHDQNIV